MSVLLAIVAVLGIAYVVKRKPTVATPEAKEVYFEEQLFPPPEARMPTYSPGIVFHHKETGEKIEVIQAPEIVNGEYVIRWPSGDIGHIHESSFEEFFE